jgi:cation transport ATPase
MQKSTVREEENTDTSQAEKHCQRRREHRHKPSRKAQSEKKRTQTLAKQKSTVREEENTDTSQAEKHSQRRREHDTSQAEKHSQKRREHRHKPSRKELKHKKFLDRGASKTCMSNAMLSYHNPTILSSLETCLFV